MPECREVKVRAALSLRLLFSYFKESADAAFFAEAVRH
jgi:hypothetical protein